MNSIIKDKKRQYYPLCFLLANANVVNKSSDSATRRKCYNSKIKGLDFTNKLHMLAQ